MNIAGPCLNQSTDCVAILRSLPQWFGMEQSIVNDAKTRAFYQAVGFRPLEELTDLWSEENPCLLMIKWIGNRAK